MCNKEKPQILIVMETEAANIWHLCYKKEDMIIW